MRDELRGFLAELRKTFTHQVGRANARFAHVKIPSYRLDVPSLMEAIRLCSMQDKDDGGMLIVTSELEKDIGVGVELSSQSLLDVLNFTEFLDCIKKNRGGLMRRMNPAWQRYPSADKRYIPVLPRNLLIVFQIDPTIPAECALALISLVDWALKASSTPKTNIRVLTLCSDDDCNFLAKLVSLQAPDVVVKDFNLTRDEYPASRALIHCSQDDADAAALIMADIKQEPDLSQLVVSFRPLDPTDFEEFGDQFDSKSLLSGGQGYVLRNATQRQGRGAHVWVTINPALAILPVAFEGYDKMHVLLESAHAPSVCWSSKSRQMVSMRRFTSSEERLSQLLWARQPFAKQVCLYTREECIESETEGSSSFRDVEFSRHRHVENAQLGGFIAAVVDISSSLELNVDGVLACFVRCPLRVDEMTHRLELQRIVSHDKLAMNPSECVAFKIVLPLVGYDHRLAFFVALDCDDVVRKVKIQLAAILAIDIAYMFGLDVTEQMDPSCSKAQEIMDACWGYGSALARQGTMWLTLGIWKYYERTISDGSAPMLDEQTVFPTQGLTENANLLKRRIAQSLLGHRIESRESEHVDREDKDIGEERKKLLQAQLLQAYVFQLASGCYPKIDGVRKPGRGFRHKVLSSTGEAHVAPDQYGLTSLVDVERLLLESGRDFVLGISHSMRRNSNGGEELFMSDWTMIPIRVVCEWLVNHAPGLNIHAALSSGIPHYPQDNSEFFLMN
ncbi:Ff.00g119200.m01.CDS01 [Fusarium sp. VM40]|nr:Ff.00g119200.m01.CDS01 [Fusarium sp. VM40]